MVEKVLQKTAFQNGEREVKVHSIIVHETDSGYAQCFFDDAHSKLMGEINLSELVFSEDIKKEWSDEFLWEKLLSDSRFI